MSELNRELKEFLSRNNKSSDKESLLPSTIKDLKLPKLSSWFVTSESNNAADNIESGHQAESSSWFSTAQKDPLFPSLGRKQRIIGFLGCVMMGILCFSLAGMYAPFLILKARKFSLLFTLGSLFSILSFSFLWGPVNHLKILFSSERILFTTIYLLSLFGTLYSALSLQSTIFTTAAAVVQVVALLCFIISNIPGGQAGIKFMTGICTAIVKRLCSRIMPG